MSKTSSKWVCQECGYSSISYLGKCPECNSWGALVEEITYKKSGKSNQTSSNSQFTQPSKSTEQNIERIKTFDSEIDTVLGGGFVPGSLILLAGEPGIGKSTILSQLAGHLSKKLKVAYVSAEESINQVQLRLKRLKLSGHEQEKNLFLLAENNLEAVLDLIEKEKLDFVIIDSIQAIFHPDIESGIGNVSQVRECASKILRFAKDKNITTVIVGHVNKEGQIAGPKVLEHIVDTVLYMGGEKFHNFRILRTTKNRYGCTDEITVFEMKDDGLKTISNPSFIFLSQNKEPVPGSTYAALIEGSKSIICEVQALIGSTTYTAPRRMANGLDYNRVLQIIAILERRVGFNFSKHDLYVNLVGGLNSSEPALDLAIAVAVVSCKQDVIPEKRTVYIGEVGLTGEIRQVNQTEQRIKECIKLGFERVVIPDGTEISKKLFNEIEIIPAKKILEAIRCSLKTLNKTENVS